MKRLECAITTQDIFFTKIKNYYSTWRMSNVAPSLNKKERIYVYIILFWVFVYNKYENALTQIKLTIAAEQSSSLRKKYFKNNMNNLGLGG